MNKVETIDLTLNKFKEKKSFQLCIVMPIYNESTHIESVLNDWIGELEKHNINSCFVIVNDGSTDNSTDEIKKVECPIYIINKRNSGHGRSVRTGYDFCISCLKTEYILQIDSDGQCLSVFFHEFWNQRTNYDFIIGSRVQRGDGFGRILTSKISTFLIFMLTSMNLKDANTPYRLMTSDCLEESLKYVKESFDIHNIALTYVVTKKKFNIKRVRIEFPDRVGGENSINITKVFQMGLNMLFDLKFLKNDI